MSYAAEAGFKVGDIFVITGQHGPKDIAKHGFEIGEKVQLTEDDGSKEPLFKSFEDQREWYVNLNYVALEVELGPVEGVLWSEAPVGATHYSTHSDHASKWHKLSNGVWSYHVGNTEGSGYWTSYGMQCHAHPESQKVIPQLSVKALYKFLDKANSRVTRTGSRVGRAEARWQQASINHEAALLAQAKAKQAVEQAVEFEKANAEPEEVYTLKALQEIAEDCKLWKAGMLIINISDDSIDIDVGRVYKLTEDVKSDETLSFEDNVGFPRSRFIDNDYRLDVGFLIGKPVFK